MTSSEMGAEPVTMSLTRPPRAALVFLKTRRSQSQCLLVGLPQHEPLSMRRRLDAIALAKYFCFLAGRSAVLAMTVEYTRLRSRGTEGKIVGRSALMSSIRSLGSPE
eukprot:Amastigsp_a182067_10.p6 type:complete len:107 gc:universal Amastigsp_a182067_10:881-1201(+)